jgi:hypothetical protein
MARLAYLAPLALPLLLVGCGPYLNAEVVSNPRAYASQARCGQGPYEFHATAIGNRWGEAVTLYQAGGKPVVGHTEIWIDGKKVAENDTNGVAYDNQACVVGPQDGVGVGGGVPVTSGGGGGGGTSIGGGYPPTITTGSGPPPALIEVSGRGLPQWNDVLRWQIQVDDWSKKDLILKAGVDIKIVFWSKFALDLKDVHFVIGQSIFVPSSGDDKWIAHLDEQKADREKKEREARAERDAEEKARQAENDRCRALALKNQLDDKCKKAGWHDVAEGEEDRRCNALALQNAIDDRCRAIGWHNLDERPDYVAGGRKTGGQPITSWSGGGTTHTGTVTQTHEPNGPPPAPRVEIKTPQPSEHAEWIDGSWRWSGYEWVWLSGGWKVPDADRVQKRTPTAPTAPPPLQAEAKGSAPVSGAVWVDGYWAWTGGWTWVPGRWSMPPSPGATWRPSVWVPEGVTVRLDPGAWILGR